MNSNPLHGKIESLQNLQVKHLLKLRRRPHRDRERLMIVEGKEGLESAIRNGLKPVSVFYCDSFCAAHDSVIIDRCAEAGANVFHCSPRAFRKMAYRHEPEGPIAIFPQIRPELEDIKLSGCPLLVVAESIEKPGNIGAIIRSADAAGADAVILCGHGTDIFNPNVIRSSIGTLFNVPVIEAASENALAWLRSHEVCVLAAIPEAEAVYTETDLRRGFAVVLGGEHRGVSKLWRDSADMQIRVPMQGRADSLNVSVTAAVILFEAIRQRQLLGLPRNLWVR